MEKKGEVSEFFLVSQSGFFFSRRKKNALSISLLPLSLCLSVFSLCFCVRLLFFVSSPSTMGREEEDYPGAFFAVVVVESIERASSVSATRRSSGRARERESEALDRRRLAAVVEPDDEHVELAPAQAEQAQQLAQERARHGRRRASAAASPLLAPGARKTGGSAEAGAARRDV